MKRIALVILTIFVVAGSFAQSSGQLNIYGNLTTNQRLLISGGQWFWNENRLTLDLEKTITGNTKFYSELWLRNIGLPQAESPYSLADLNSTDPFSLVIRQAYATAYGLIGGKLDLTVGKQIFSWGTADRFNPTNNLSPYDYEDLLDFGRKCGVFAIKADFYINSDNYVEAVFEPFFRPVQLPYGQFAQLLSAGDTMQLPQNVTLAGTSEQLIMPPATLKDNFSAGVRFKGFLAGFDYSLSYVYGYDQAPVQSQTVIDLALTSAVYMTFDANVSTDMNFYRNHILGADLAGNIGGVGVWAEAALFIPKDDVVWQITTVYPQALNMPDQTTDSVLFPKDKPYVKYVLGADYTFGNGIYLNTQFIHGFTYERWQGNLNDYLFVRAEKSFFNDKLKLAPLSGGIMVSDWQDVKNNYAIAWFPQITYTPADNFELTLSTGIFNGKGKGLFASLDDYNLMMFSMKYSF